MKAASLACSRTRSRVLILDVREICPCLPNAQQTRCERTGHRDAEQRDEVAAPHSITSSARPNTGSGTVMPSALAPLRFRNSSNFVTCGFICCWGASMTIRTCRNASSAGASSVLRRLDYQKMDDGRVGEARRITFAVINVTDNVRGELSAHVITASELNRQKIARAIERDAHDAESVGIIDTTDVRRDHSLYLTVAKDIFSPQSENKKRAISHPQMCSTINSTNPIPTSSTASATESYSSQCR